MAASNAVDVAIKKRHCASFFVHEKKNQSQRAKPSIIILDCPPRFHDAHNQRGLTPHELNALDRMTRNKKQFSKYAGSDVTKAMRASSLLTSVLRRVPRHSCNLLGCSFRVVVVVVAGVQRSNQLLDWARTTPLCPKRTHHHTRGQQAHAWGAVSVGLSDTSHHRRGHREVVVRSHGPVEGHGRHAEVVLCLFGQSHPHHQHHQHPSRGGLLVREPASR
jgi:hypothetical protein